MTGRRVKILGSRRAVRQRSFDSPALIARIAINATDYLRVSLDTSKGAPLIDVRVFSIFVAAKVTMTTRHAISVPPEFVPDLVQALQSAQLAAGGLV